MSDAIVRAGEGSGDGAAPFDMEEAISRVASRGIKPGLAAIRELLRRLGDPHLGLPVVHVAGTNGKGSVCAMLERCLRAAGLHTGLFTSPHMICYNERFRFNGEMIGDGEMASLLGEAAACADAVMESVGARPTQFELLTAMAFLWFSRRKPDVLILETGMGGRYDATNVIPTPLLTIITNISMDHENFLGDSIETIAREKAGICKPGVPLITACDNPQALAVIRRAFMLAQAEPALVQATGASPVPPAPLFHTGTLCRWAAGSAGGAGLAEQAVDLVTPLRAYEALAFSFPGKYQHANLACAVLAWEYLGITWGDQRASCACTPTRGGALSDPGRFTEAALRQGLRAARWPCRLETVQEKPRVVLDGAHNPEGLRGLAEWLAAVRGHFEQVYLVMGMLEDKDRIASASMLDGMVARVIITRPPSARAGAWQELAGGFPQTPKDKISFVEDCRQALHEAIALAGDPDLVLCTGSLYLAGELRKNWAEKSLFDA